MILIHDTSENPTADFFVCSIAEKKVAVLAKDERDAANKVLMELFKNHKDEEISMVVFVEGLGKQIYEIFRTDEILRDIGLHDQAQTMTQIFGEESQ